MKAFKYKKDVFIKEKKTILKSILFSNTTSRTSKEDWGYHVVSI